MEIVMGLASWVEGTRTGVNAFKGLYTREGLTEDELFLLVWVIVVFELLT